MPFTIGTFIARQPSLSPAEFQAAFEEYVTFLRSTIGEAGAPESILRNYVRRNDSGKIISPSGSEETFGYDLVSYMNFRDEQHAKAFQQAYGQHEQEIGAKVAQFAELSHLKVIAFQDSILD